MRGLLKEWYKYDSKGSFFGPFYRKGDCSREGYLVNNNMTLEERTTREVEGVLRIAGDLLGKKKLSILDAPCGYGRHAREFLSRGHRVSVADINKYYIDGLLKEVDALEESRVCE